jgi:hypothetical protein
MPVKAARQVEWGTASFDAECHDENLVINGANVAEPGNPRQAIAYATILILYNERPSHSPDWRLSRIS